MTLGNIYIHRAKKVKAKLDAHEKTHSLTDGERQKRYFQNLRGIHSARLFGLCIYRSKELI